VKRPSPSDFQRDQTDPGQAGSAASSEPQVEDGGYDEFPSEATRIDPGLGASAGAAQAGAALPSRSAPPPASRSAPPPASRPAEQASPPKNQMSAKLAALQSLSLDAPPSTATASPQPSARAPASGGSSKLPWVLLFLVLLGVGGNWAVNKYHIAVPGLSGVTGGNTGGSTDPTAVPAVKTEIANAVGGSGAAPLIAAGFTAARDPISIGVPSGGVIKEVKVVNGDKVKAGHPVVLLDDSSAIADKSLALAEIHDAERNLAQINALAKAQAATIVEVGKARGAVEIARAKLRPIEQRIRQMRIAAPADVTVLEVLVHPGETVANNAPVVKVADLAKLVAETDINEADVVKVRRGQSVDVTSDTFADKIFKGVVREIAENVDKTRGTVQVKVDLQVPDLSLRPGMSVKCAFQPDQGAKPRMYVSRTAVTPAGKVFLVGADNLMHERAVQFVAGSGTTVEITSGLSNGDRILSDANLGRDGQPLPTQH
jgi:RND family efflux transporter MFP subunit